MARIRLVEPGVVYNVVHNTVDRAFTFAPDHHPDQPLLRLDCPAYALNPDNDILPVPSTLNIIGAALARAQELAPVQLHAAEVNLSHLHSVLSALNNQLTNIADFYRNAMSRVARRINFFRQREGHLFGGAMRVTPCDNDEQAKQKVLYALTNTVKDGLTPTVHGSPLFNTYRIQALGQPQRYFDYRFADYHAAGGIGNPRHRLKDYIVWKELKITPLPCFAGMKPEQIQTFWRKHVQQFEQEKAEERKAQGRAFMAVSRLFELKADDKPKEPRVKTPQPLVHASTPEAEKAYEEKYREVQKQHRIASIAYRQGDLAVEFPPGTYRPPLIRVIDSS
jgi:hypothetical protein